MGSTQPKSLSDLMETEEAALTTLVTSAPGPSGRLPLSSEMLSDWASGDLFGLSQDVGMGWSPTQLAGPSMLILSTQGGLRNSDGTPTHMR